MADETDDDLLMRELRSLGQQPTGPADDGVALPRGGWQVEPARAGYEMWYVPDYPRGRFELRRQESNAAPSFSTATDPDASTSDAVGAGRFARRPIADAAERLPRASKATQSATSGARQLSEIEDTQTRYEAPTGFIKFMRDQARGGRVRTPTDREVRWVAKDTTGNLNRRQWFDDEFGEGAWEKYRPRD